MLRTTTQHSIISEATTCLFTSYSTFLFMFTDEILMKSNTLILYLKMDMLQYQILHLLQLSSVQKQVYSNNAI